MKKISFILMTAILLAGGAVAVMSTHSYAQVYEYPPPPSDPSASPWVRSDTPWVYYDGDWFMNGILYYYYGPDYGGPPITLILSAILSDPEPGMLRDGWRGIRGSLLTWRVFNGSILVGRGHRQGQRYSQKFYEQHHGGQGGGWQQGLQGPPALLRAPSTRTCSR